MGHKCIDADALKDAVEDWFGDLPPVLADMNYVIDEMPAADVEPVRHGGWVKDRCSICGAPKATDSLFDYLDKNDQKFCYSCGAKMDGGSE